MADLHLSKEGTKFIGRFEGLRLTAYRATPSEQYLTIGYGHYGPDVKPGQTISEPQALKLLHKDAAEAGRAVRDLVKVPIGQHKFDALTSFVFNLGAGAFGSSTLLHVINSNGTAAQITAEFEKWVYAGGQRLAGLEARRKAEAKLYTQGKYQ